MISFKISLSNPFPRFNIIIWVPSQSHTFLLSEMWKGCLYIEFGRCKEVLILCILQVQIPGRTEQSDRAAWHPGGLLSEKLQNRFLPAILYSMKSPGFTAHGWACGFHRPGEAPWLRSGTNPHISLKEWEGLAAVVPVTSPKWEPCPTRREVLAHTPHCCPKKWPISSAITCSWVPQCPQWSVHPFRSLAQLWLILHISQCCLNSQISMGEKAISLSYRIKLTLSCAFQRNLTKNIIKALQGGLATSNLQSKSVLHHMIKENSSFQARWPHLWLPSYIRKYKGILLMWKFKNCFIY